MISADTGSAYFLCIFLFLALLHKLSSDPQLRKLTQSATLLAGSHSRLPFLLTLLLFAASPLFLHPPPPPSTADCYSTQYMSTWST